MFKFQWNIHRYSDIQELRLSLWEKLGKALRRRSKSQCFWLVSCSQRRISVYSRTCLLTFCKTWAVSHWASCWFPFHSSQLQLLTASEDSSPTRKVMRSLHLCPRWNPFKMGLWFPSDCCIYFVFQHSYFILIFSFCFMACFWILCISIFLL